MEEVRRKLLSGRAVTGEDLKAAGVSLHDVLGDEGSQKTQSMEFEDIDFADTLLLKAFKPQFLLTFRRCTFAGGIKLTDAVMPFTRIEECTVAGLADFRGSHFATGLSLKGTTFEGACLLRDAIINGALNFSDCRFTARDLGDIADAEGEIVGLSRAQITSLYWRGISGLPKDARMNLSDCRIASIRDGGAVPEWPAEIRMRGLTYDHRENLDARYLMSWIGRAENDRQQVFQLDRAIAIAVSEGQVTLERTLRVARQKKLISADRSFPERAVRWLYLVFSQGGQSIERALLSTLIVFAVSALAVFFMRESGDFVPVRSDVTAHSCFDLAFVPDEQTPCTNWVDGAQYRLPRDYPQFSVVGYAADVFVPVIDYEFSNFWVARSLGGQLLVSLIKTLGIACFSILAICIAGVITRK